MIDRAHLAIILLLAEHSLGKPPAV